jgi:hypothetical protein
MRLYKIDGQETEWTGVQIQTCEHNSGTGGTATFTYLDPLMTNIATPKKFLGQRIEIRKNDGTTVLWEGVITRARFAGDTWFCEAQTPLRMLDSVVSNYNAELAAGVVQGVDADDTPPSITDVTQQLSTTAFTGKYVLFTGDGSNEPAKEEIWCNTDSTFVENGALTDTPSSTSYSGTHTDVVGGYSGMYIYDTTDKAADYWGVHLSFTAPNHATSNYVEIFLFLEFEQRADYPGNTHPLVQVYDDTNTAWRTTDIANELTGVGRVEGGTDWGGSANSQYQWRIYIEADMSDYFDANGKLLVQVLCGATGDARDSVRVSNAILTNTYTTGEEFLNNAYPIDNITNPYALFSLITFSAGQTPQAHGVRAENTYKIGDLYHNVVPELWKHAGIWWCNHDVDTTTLVSAGDFRGTYVASILRKFARNQGWAVWDEIGWDVEMDLPAASTGLSLTEANFLTYDYLASVDRTAKRIITSAATKTNTTFAGNQAFPRFSDRPMLDRDHAAESEAIQAAVNYIAQIEDFGQSFSGTIDLDDGTDYSALAMEKLITITLYTNKVVLTEKRVRHLSYDQTQGGHLFATIEVKIGE